MLKNFFTTPKTPEQAFWAWFMKNQDTYYHYEDHDLNQIFDDLAEQLRKINPDLVFEFHSELKDGKRDFVISADGMRSVARSVIRVVENAPPLEKWNIVAFRPRGSVDEIKMGDLILSIDNILFAYTPRQDGLIDVDLYVPHFQDEMIGAVFLMLDSLIGEFDVMAKLANIDFHPLSEGKNRNVLPLRELRNLVDGLIQSH